MNKADFKTIGQALGLVSMEASPEQLAILSLFESQLNELFMDRGVSLDKLDAITKHRKDTELSQYHDRQSPLSHAYKQHERDALSAKL